MDVLASLSHVRSLAELIYALRSSARTIAECDGITIVRRVGDRVVYVAEDALSPLWIGQSFPIEACVSGQAMLRNQPILIPDVFADPRVPHAAYRTTFVNSMAMFPIGSDEPQLALGAYWHEAGPIDPDAAQLLASLARAAGAAFDRVEKREAQIAADKATKPHLS
jgi:GAF domain-containing protein